MEHDDNNGSYCGECGVYNNSSRTECRKCKSPMGETNELLCPCGHPLLKHLYSGCYEVTNSPKVGDFCSCTISCQSLEELEEALRKLAAYEDKRNYAPMRHLANAAADVLACWRDEDRANELDHFMGALKRALENYKG